MDLPIPFSKPMVLALLSDRKFETRRLADSVVGNERLMCRACCCSEREWKDGTHSLGCSGTLEWTPVKKVNQRIGDRLYVREEIQAWQSGPYKYVRFAADQHATFIPWPEEWKRDSARPMHMFKRFSRMTLPVTGVRIERLHDITQAGAIAEGIERIPYEGKIPDHIGQFGWKDYRKDHPHSVVPYHDTNAVLSYRSLWESINGAGSWDRNPWVCVTSWSRVIHQNIDNIQS